MNKIPYHLTVLTPAEKEHIPTICSTLTDMRVDFKMTFITRNMGRNSYQKVTLVTVFCVDDEEFRGVKKKFPWA